MLRKEALYKVVELVNNRGTSLIATMLTEAEDVPARFRCPHFVPRSLTPVRLLSSVYGWAYAGYAAISVGDLKLGFSLFVRAQRGMGSNISNILLLLQLRNMGTDSLCPGLPPQLYSVNSEVLGLVEEFLPYVAAESEHLALGLLTDEDSPLYVSFTEFARIMFVFSPETVGNIFHKRQFSPLRPTKDEIIQCIITTLSIIRAAIENKNAGALMTCSFRGRLVITIQRWLQPAAAQLLLNLMEQNIIDSHLETVTCMLSEIHELTVDKRLEPTEWPFLNPLIYVLVENRNYIAAIRTVLERPKLVYELVLSISQQAIRRRHGMDGWEDPTSVLFRPEEKLRYLPEGKLGPVPKGRLEGVLTDGKSTESVRRYESSFSRAVRTPLVNREPYHELDDMCHEIDSASASHLLVQYLRLLDESAKKGVLHPDRAIGLIRETLEMDASAFQFLAMHSPIHLFADILPEDFPLHESQDFIKNASLLQNASVSRKLIEVGVLGGLQRVVADDKEQRPMLGATITPVARCSVCSGLISARTPIRVVSHLVVHEACWQRLPECCGGVSSTDQ